MMMHLSVRLFVRFCKELQKSKIWTSNETVKEVVCVKIKSDSTSCSERKAWKGPKPSYDHPTDIIESESAQENSMS